MTAFKETIVISVGGSLLIPERIDVSFLKHLKGMTTHFVQEGYQIVLAIGGGKTSRYYGRAALEFNHIDNTDLDWIGIKTIHLNCELVHRVFRDLDVHSDIIFKAEDAQEVVSSIIIVGAWEPGHSSDYNAVSVAQTLGAKRVINFSNTSHVYNRDPQEDSKAQKITQISWGDYRELIPKQWVSNLSTPFDPIASEMAQGLEMTVVILGASIDNLTAYLEGKSFKGTVIR